MLFNSLQYLIFFPAVVFLYYILPQKFRWIMLLCSSYYFYMCWDAKYALLMLLSTFITYMSGILIEEEENIKKKKLWVFLSFSSNLSILFFFKYFNFLGETLEAIGNMIQIGIKIPNFKVLLPVGISFYTFQALSYTVDVYRKDVKAQHNFGKYALFVSFFPQLVAGPIERSSNLLYQFDKHIAFDPNNVKRGLLLIMWGLIKKVVIADRLSILVDTVFKEPRIYYGMPLFVASIFFTFQIYCDFSGYSDIAIGSANVFGYDLMQNFRSPYFSKSIAEFWRRWHISLSSWFKDYVYIPLGGNRVSKIKKYRNIVIVFLTSGLWHGAAWHYVVWGGIHGLLQIIGTEMKPVRDFFTKIFKIDRNSFSHRLFRVIVTFLLVNIMWIFFRANSITDAFYIIKKMFRCNFWTFFDGTMYRLGLDKWDFDFSIKLIIFLVLVDYFTKDMHMRDWIEKQGLIFRWLVYLAGIFFILIFGIYGNKDITLNFIYFQF